MQAEPLTPEQVDEVGRRDPARLRHRRREPHQPVVGRAGLGQPGDQQGPAGPGRLPDRRDHLHLDPVRAEDGGRRDRRAGPRPVLTAGIYSLTQFVVTPVDGHRAADGPRLLAVRHHRRVRQGRGEHPRPGRRHPLDLQRGGRAGGQPDLHALDQHLAHRAAAGLRPAVRRRLPARRRHAQGPGAGAVRRARLRGVLLAVPGDAAAGRPQGARAAVPGAVGPRARQAPGTGRAGLRAAARTAGRRSPSRRSTAAPAPRRRADRRGRAAPAGRPPGAARPPAAPGPPARRRPSAGAAARAPSGGADVALDLEALLRTPDHRRPRLPEAGRRLQGHHPAARRPRRVRRGGRRGRVARRARDGRQGRRHRGPRLPPRGPGRLPLRRRLRADPQEGQAAAATYAESYDLEYGGARSRCTRTPSRPASRC